MNNEPLYLPITTRCLETAEGVTTVKKYDKMMELLDRCAISLNQSHWFKSHRQSRSQVSPTPRPVHWTQALGKRGGSKTENNITQRDITPYRAHAYQRYSSIESCPRARLSDFFRATQNEM